MTAIQKQLPRWAETLSGHPEFSLPGLDGRGTGSYIDQLICRERKIIVGTSEAESESEAAIPANERIYYCQNRRADVVALVTSAGRQVEQARYSAYGVPFGLPAGDADSDGDVDSADLTQIQSWIDNIIYDVRGDFDLDGDVDATDKSLANAISGTTLGRGVLTRNSTANRFGYSGCFYHQDVLKYHVRNRVYDPYIGRWTNRDPIEYEAGTMNLYEYVMSSPILLVDPFGLDALGDCKADCARRHGGYPGYTREQPYRNCIKDCKSRFKPGPSPSITDQIVDWIGPDRVLNCTGGPGHIPGIDQGPTQDVIVVCCDVVSIAAPCGAGARVVMYGGKALRAYKESSVVVRTTHIDRIRKWIRYDPPHHGKPRQWDGIIPKKIRDWFFGSA